MVKTNLIAIIALIALMGVGVTNAYADDGSDYLKNFSDYMNANWGWLFWTAVALAIIGFLVSLTGIGVIIGYPMWIVAVLIMLAIFVNWIFINPIVH